MKLEKVKLKDIAEIIMGQSPESKFYNNKGVGLPFFQGKKEFGVFHPRVEQYTEKVTKEAQKGDILFTVRAPVGDVNKAPYKCCIGRGLAAIRNRENNDFLFYFLKFTKSLFVSKSNGAIFESINKKDLEEMEIEIPELFITRQKIGKILKKYDDLIENNLKRIELLEEAAQRLYKEWFIDLRFPGYEKVQIVDGIPEGWEISNLYDICFVQMGYAFQGKYFNENKMGTPAIRIRDIPNQKTKTYTTEKADEEYKIQSGDILIGMDGIFHNDVWCGEEGYLVQRVCRLKAQQDNIQGFIWQAIKEPILNYNKSIVGATVAHLGAKHLKEIFLKHPKLKMDNFFNPLNNLMKQKILLETQNQKLTEARDRLLPKLMKGEIEI